MTMRGLCKRKAICMGRAVFIPFMSVPNLLTSAATCLPDKKYRNCIKERRFLFPLRSQVIFNPIA